MTSSQQGFLLISDITGYTRYLSASELEHAQEILTSLLELLVDHTRPPLVISRLAGDAVISYLLRGGALQGQTFVEMMETTYVEFRRAIELMTLNNSCQCNACTHIASLDLKFFVHYGAFMVQRVAGRDELVGNDVNLIHRLLKNHVTEQTGIQAYVLYTDRALEQLGMEEFRAALLPHLEGYEHIGAVQAWVQDLHPIWQERRAATRITIPPERAAMQVETEIAIPPYMVWDYLTRPECRTILAGSDGISVAGRKQGRIAPGATFHCYHGNRVTPLTLLEWEPFEQMTTEAVMLPRTTCLETIRLLPSERGTRMVQTFSKARGPWPARVAGDLALSRMGKSAKRDIEAFRAHIEKEWAGATPLPEGAATLAPMPA